jgi:predicted RNase H-like nuclease (RuvC/YqgF family)
VNLPQYQRAMREAHGYYAERLSQASDQLTSAITKAGTELSEAIHRIDEEFFEDRRAETEVQEIEDLKRSLSDLGDVNDLRRKVMSRRDERKV